MQVINCSIICVLITNHHHASLVFSYFFATLMPQETYNYRGILRLCQVHLPTLPSFHSVVARNSTEDAEVVPLTLRYSKSIQISYFLPLLSGILMKKGPQSSFSPSLSGALIMLLCYAQSCQSRLTLCNPMDCNPRGSSVSGIFRQEYWSGLLFPSLGIFPTQELNPRLQCLLQMNSLRQPSALPVEQWKVLDVVRVPLLLWLRNLDSEL